MSPTTVNRTYADDPIVDRSLRHSVRDAAAYSVMTGGGETYFSAFAVFLKASTPQVALLASLPSLLGSFAQLFSAWWGHRKGVRKSHPQRRLSAGCHLATLDGLAAVVPRACGGPAHRLRRPL
jgi:hypothetical protein